MNLLNALKNIGHLYMDTAPLIYYVEEHPTYIKRMDKIIEEIQKKPITVTCSVLTLTEILPVPLKAGNSQLIQDYRDILLYSKEFRMMNISEQIAGTAAQLRATYNLKTPDALHLATAIETRCGAFLTNDKTLKRVMGVQILVLDELV